MNDSNDTFLMIMPIIGLCGHKGSGKDTIANMLVQNDDFIKIAFADFIRNAAKELFNWDDSRFEQENKEKIDEYWGVTPRKILQELGTEFLRIHCKPFLSMEFKLPNNDSYEGTFHIKRINQEVMRLLEINSNVNIIFSDIRFQDELDYIKKLGGYIIKVTRPSLSKNKFSQHISEKNISSLNNVDYEIVNDHNIPHLYKKTSIIVEHIVADLHQDH